METKLVFVQIISSFIFDWSQELIIPCISYILERFSNLNEYFEPLHLSFVACLVSNLLPSDTKHSFASKALIRFFQNLQAWVERYKINLFHQQTSYAWNAFYLLIAGAIQDHSHLFDDVHVGLKIYMIIST